MMPRFDTATYHHWNLKVVLAPFKLKRRETFLYFSLNVKVFIWKNLYLPINFALMYRWAQINICIHKWINVICPWVKTNDPWVQIELFWLEFRRIIFFFLLTEVIQLFGPDYSLRECREKPVKISISLNDNTNGRNLQNRSTQQDHCL